MGIVLAALAAGCSSKKDPEPADAREKAKAEAKVKRSNSQAEYVSGIAAAYYCTCSRWPGTWDELHRFDDFLHSRAEQGGEAPLKRFAWGDIVASLNVHADSALMIRPKDTGRDKSEDEANLEPIAVPTPDCSRFDRNRFAGGCERSAAVTR
jgi:hypothetical protein